MHGRGEQALRVGVLRVGKNPRHRALLDDPAGIHHGDPVRDLAGDAEVMGDEDRRHAEFLLQPAQQDKHLHLHGGVECGGRFVGQQQARPAGQCHRNHRALAQPARQFMRVGIQPALGRWDFHQFEKLERACPCRRVGSAKMRPHGLDDLRADGVDRIKRRHRLLEDHRRQAAAQRAQAFSLQRQHILPRDMHRP